MRLGIGLLALAALGLSAGTAAAQPASSARVEVPIRQTILPDGVLRYSIPIQIGGSTVEAMLDSGSTGLRVLPGAVAAGDVTPSSRKEEYGYTSGVKLIGVMAEAVVSIGGLAADRPIPIHMVSSLTCDPRKPCQAAARLPFIQYGVGGDGIPNQGFKAILGVNMGDAPATNPLTHIGQRAWIIVLPRPGEREPGRLILNPDASDRAGYTTMAIDPMFSDQRGRLHDAIPGCLGKPDGGEPLCGPTVLDTGAPGVQVSLGAGVRPVRWNGGERASVAFQGPGGRPIGAAFVVGSGPGTRVTVEPGDGHPRTQIGAGILPFYAFTVLYDDKAGEIGLKAR